MALKGIASLQKALSEIDEQQNKKLKGIFLQGLGNIASGTPVDEGRARSNWFLTVGSATTEKTQQENGDPHLGKMPNRVLGVRLFYSNNMPYINRLEYDGHSDQAPFGWVRSELLMMRAAIRKI
jgi:hypothetical protein